MPNYRNLYFRLYGRLADLSQQLLDTLAQMEELYLAEGDEPPPIYLAPPKSDDSP